MFQAPVRSAPHCRPAVRGTLARPAGGAERAEPARLPAQAPANLLVKYRDQASVTERIRRLLRRHLRDELPSLEEVGASLGMTPQTLRRRLREEGQGFQALKDDLRRDAGDRIPVRGPT